MLAADLAAIREAARRIAPYAHRTPVVTSQYFDRVTGGQLFFKCENLQKAGAFKFRGACNAVFSLSDEEAARGVATHSSGNHAQALALAAQLRGIPAWIVMPENAPAVKQAAVREYGGQIVHCTPTLAAREATAAAVVRETGATLIHPYDDARIIAGQGTAALELLETVPELDLILTPVGGGGLLSGTAITVAELAPSTAVVAAEPAGADDAYRSLAAGHIIPVEQPNTVADGLRTSLGELTFAVIQQHVREIVTVSDDEIVAAMKTFWQRTKLLIEPSSAVPLAAVLSDRISTKGRRIGIILSGGNVDPAAFG